MEHFPAQLSRAQSDTLIERIERGSSTTASACGRSSCPARPSSSASRGSCACAQTYLRARRRGRLATRRALLGEGAGQRGRPRRARRRLRGARPPASSSLTPPRQHPFAQADGAARHDAHAGGGLRAPRTRARAPARRARGLPAAVHLSGTGWASEMCGRYTNTAGPEELNDCFRVPIHSERARAATTSPPPKRCSRS